MIRIPGRIPILIHPTFWLIAAIIGFFNSHSLPGTLIWIGIILISVLVHELGHALTAVLFKQNPRIELVAMGGLTYHEGGKLPFVKQFFIVFDGPLFGFFLFLFATLLLQFQALSTGFMGAVLQTFQWVNLFWTILNLVPVMPLDGGQLLRIILERICGVKGFKYALFTSMVFSLALSLVFFILQDFFVGALFFLLAFQSYESWRRMRQMSETDRNESLKKALEQAENQLQSGRKDEAIESFEKIRKQAGAGMIYNLATEYLAYSKYEIGKTRDSYELLMSIKPQLSGDALCLLHRAAFDEKDYPLVVELGGTCFQTWPTAETALRNAYSCACLSQTKAAIGWLQTALKEGLQNVQEVLQESHFNAIRLDPVFQEFIKSLHE